MSLTHAATWCQCYKTNTAVIYCHFRLNNCSNIITLNLTWNGSKLLWHDSKLLQYFNPRKSRVKTTTVNLCGIFITLSPGARNWQLS
jgi:hypothetical protein